MASKQVPLIETVDLRKSYFSEELETAVLHGLNLTINEEEFVSIMGPSGSGKSTLMHILGFLDQPTSGKYLFRGEATRTMTDDELAAIRATRVSFVFQAFNLLPRTTVLENVMLPLLYHPTIPASERRDRAMHAIETVGLGDRATYYTNQLSGGQQQRTAIARALVTEPDVIFADEPTGNLDSKSGNQVMEAIQELHAAGGRTIILVTHEQNTAQHAKRIIHLRDGHIDSDTTKFKRLNAKKNHNLTK
ncbi:ABC transporter ATP-binding protein [Candidatus Peribacteria bacterium]|nr:ABC transporter ATP-binding protein [Candidatus Peribacteria bacterium]